MGVKNNFSQAVSELIGISKNTEPQVKEETDVEERTEAIEEAEAAAEEPAEEVAMEQDMAAEESETEAAEEREEAAQTVQNPKERIMAMLSQQSAQQPASPQGYEETEFQDQQSEAGLTTIARGTVIIGEINAEGDVELLGSVKGKIASKGDIRANGKVIGDLIGRDIELIACAVQGNIIANGLVTVDGESIVIGDVKGENFCLDGKIKGNVTVEKEAKFQPKAILAGNVTTASIAMSQGAKIQGEVNIPLNEKETDMSFDINL
ncbi:MAG TPA: polymer-forming cytoskeletal protein [Bacillota bacterium]|nr:polymer-forming cytoskeletal protein [Bacillota bacterium]